MLLILLINVQGKPFVKSIKKISDPGFPGDIDPGEPLPIVLWLFPMLALGIILGYYQAKKTVKALK